MRTTKKVSLVAIAATIGIGLALGPVAAANAFTTKSGGQVTCSSSAVPDVEVASHAYGRVNHSINSATWESWNNGSSYQYRFTYSGLHTVQNWGVFLTGSGGNIDYADYICYG